MGSLNGDIMVMRNGRSTSQVSVYNYPEHLNPFYEYDQHKRLRFWKVNKKDNNGRRNSFSIANLKDMWAFKSFRMKKKSSTLGINKTSESPPLLRRDYAVDNGWNTFDHRLRASNTSSINGDSFQRNAIYRSSLQTLPTNNEHIGLNRNDGYRSTIQVTRLNPRYQPQQKQHHQQHTMGVTQNRRYVYGGSVTPQPLRNARTNIDTGPYEYEYDNAMIRGSSQASMLSTNPFESDDDENENEDINSSGIKCILNGSTTALTSRTPRKKRRAPAPPTPVHNRSNGGPPALPIIRIETSHETQDELCIKEDIDIANLTAEIESFVKTKSNDDDLEVTQKNGIQIATKDATTEFQVKNPEMNREIQEITSTPKGTSYNAIKNMPEEKINATANTNTNANAQITNEIVTVITDTKTTVDGSVPVKKAHNVAQVSNEIDTTTDENKDIKINGAIPKKNTNNSVASSLVVQQLQQQSTPADAELSIKETHAKELPEKPIPVKRQSKPEAEVGHIECIHVHVESPIATPRKDHRNSLSSFKTIESTEATKIITTKTPFILTSPPTQRRNCQLTENGELVIKETVMVNETSLVSKRTNELNIKEEEERINAKPEILAKPILSPKPVTKESNGKINNFAEIHKPMRRNPPTGHIRKASRDETIFPPNVPKPETKEQEKKINDTDDYQVTDRTIENKAEDLEARKLKPYNSLKIIESAIGDHESVKEVIGKNCETVATATLAQPDQVQKSDDEYDMLYRSKPTSHMEWKRSTLAPLESNIPPEKRKSVKDIIESINRSQRLLHAAANKDFTVLQNQNTTTRVTGSGTITTPLPSTTPTTSNNNNNNLNENSINLDNKQNENQHITEDMPLCADDDCLAGATSSPSPSPSNYNNEYMEAQKLDNIEIFQKCKVKKEVYDYRETSPITSNLDWNPVPKPKRTKPGHE